MAFDDATLQVAGAAIAARITHVSLHTTGTVTQSTNESAAARKPVSWTNTNGDLSAGPINFTGGAASGPVVRVGYWTASTAGTYCGGVMLTGDSTFNAAGEYTVTSITENASSS